MDKMAENRAYNTIIYEKDKDNPRIAWIILNRPEKTNAISIGADKMTGELQDALKRVDADQEIKVVVIKANGTHFCAGFDLSMVYRVYGGKPGFRPHQSERLRIDEEQLLGYPNAVFNCKKVTIAQVQGWCIEAGLWLVELCDIAIAADNAKFAHRGQRLAFGGMPFPHELVSGHTKKNVELLITGRTVSGAQAEEMGIITKAVPPEDLESEVYQLAEAITLIPLDAICMGKMCRKHTFAELGMNNWWNMITYHTLGTNITYREDEKDTLFIRDREKVGEKEAFHKLHRSMEEALAKTKYFKSYTG
jgi:enoyl-CoA hydratase